MIRLQAYDDCANCIWFANPLKCNEYETCRSCPNSVDGSRICCEQKPEDEENVHILRRKTMTKQEQIEEMAKNYCKNGLFCSRSCQTDGCRTYETCETLYNAGYRKVDDDCAVITKAELKQYKVQAVKDTAKEILQYVGDLYDDCDQRFRLKDYQWHENLCKKYGVEVKK